MNIDIQQMQTFLTVVREQNFRRAAKFLNVSQPTVTLRIKALEEEVGAILINRNDNRLTLTPSGETVLAYIEKMLYVVQDVKDHLSSLPLQRNRLSIAAIPSFCSYALPLLLKKKNQSDLHFTIQNVSSMKVRQLVSDGAVDFGVMRGPINMNKDLENRLLYQEKIFLATPKNHALIQKEKIYIQDLLNENIITFRRRFWTFFANRVLELGSSFTEKIIVDSETTAKQFVANGLGITILPEHSVKLQDKESIVLREIEDFSIVRNAFLVYREDQDIDLIETFYTLVKSCLQNESGGEAFYGIHEEHWDNWIR